MSGRRPGTGTNPFTRLQGVWRSHGYGLLLDIGPTSYRLYEETALGWLYCLEEPLTLLHEHYTDLRVSPRREAFSARRTTGVTRIKYRRLQRMPTVPVVADGADAMDPQLNFDVLAQTFSERYALFDLRGVDWPATIAEHRPRVLATTSSRALFDTFRAMLTPLRDGHVQLRAPHRQFNAGDFAPLYKRLSKQLRVGDETTVDVATVLGERRQQLAAIIRERYLGGRSRRSGNRQLEWGRLDQRTGYLAIHAMSRQSGRLDDPRGDQQAAARAMTRCLRDIGELPELVIDLRGNGGGYDGVALRLAGFLTDRRRLAFTKAPSKGEGYGATQSVFIEPRGSIRYRGHIHLLTSPLTASAAEIFILALLRRPRLTRIGEATQGILSDVMERHLPNGWSVSLSNELYRAIDGELYEDRGIPPTIEVPFLDQRSLDAGRDVVLDRVLETRT